MDWLLLIASFLVAGGTLALAFATFKMMRKTDKWNQRIEQRTLKWNKRNEWTRTLPFLSINKVTLQDSSEGWVRDLYVEVKNIGLGPAVSYRIQAKQGKRTLHTIGPAYTSEDVANYRPLEAGGEPHKCHLRNTEALPKNESSHVEIRIEFRDVYAHPHEAVYKLEPLQGPQGDWLQRLSDPTIVALKIDGKKIKLPTDDSSSPSEYDDDISMPFSV